MSIESNINVQAAIRRIATHGPDRVIINLEGEGISPDRASKQHGITSKIIFIRNDGWSLGAPSQFEHVAYLTWKDEWVAFIRRPGSVVSPISEYDAKA